MFAIDQKKKKVVINYLTSVLESEVLKQPVASHRRRNTPSRELNRETGASLSPSEI